MSTPAIRIKMERLRSTDELPDRHRDGPPPGRRRNDRLWDRISTADSDDEGGRAAWAGALQPRGRGPRAAHRPPSDERRGWRRRRGRKEKEEK